MLLTSIFDKIYDSFVSFVSFVLEFMSLDHNNDGYAYKSDLFEALGSVGASPGIVSPTCILCRLLQY